MICVKTLHLRLNRVLLLAVGLWPYERSKLIELQLILFSGTVTTFTLYQFITLVTTKCTPQFVTEVLSFSSFWIILTINYNMFCFNIGVIKELLETLQRTYDDLRHGTEVLVIEKYANTAERYTGALALLSLFVTPIFGFAHSWPRILDATLLANESLSDPTLLIKTEYFVDQEKFYYLFMMYTIAAFVICGAATVATTTMSLVYFEYACGMLKIASYRIEHAITKPLLQTNSVKGETINLVYRNIIQAVYIHRNTMEFINLYTSKFNVFYCLMTIGIVISMSLNLFQGVLRGRGTMELIIPLVCLFVNYLCTFLINYYGQKVMEHNNNLFTTVYNTQWYFAPLSIQKIMLFLLQRGAKTFNLSVGGLFVASLENAATMMSASISYFTLLYSIGHP